MAALSTAKRLSSECRSMTMRRGCLSVFLATTGTWLVLVVLHLPHTAIPGFYCGSPTNYSGRESETPLLNRDECVRTIFSMKSVKGDSETRTNNSIHTRGEGGGEQVSILTTKISYVDSARNLSIAWTQEMKAEWEAVLRERRQQLKEACVRLDTTDNSTRLGNFVQSNNLIWARQRRLVWCPIFKAASTTWTKNLLQVSKMQQVAANSGRGQKKKVKVPESLQQTAGSRGRALLRNLYPAPSTTQERTKLLKSSMRMIIVRNPFERLLSAYRDKMLRVVRGDERFIRMQQRIAHSYPDAGDQPTPYTAEELGRASTVKRNTTNLVHPTFTQFLMSVRDEVDKALKKGHLVKRSHWHPFWLICAPCQIDYDIIGHMETFTMDQEYVIRELGLEDILHLGHYHASRNDGFNDTSEAAKKYFKQVPESLMLSIANLFHLDFELFGYSPEKYLALSRTTR